jgi:hypothetical protein
MCMENRQELRNQLEKCKERMREVQKEQEELHGLQKQTVASIQTLEALIRKPGVSFWEKLKIRSQRLELNRLESKCKKRERQLGDLLHYKLRDERKIIEDQLRQLEPKK